jgi:alkylhydroperoxidase family enzyme
MPAPADRPATPRIAPLTAADFDAADRALLADLPGADLNIVATLMRHPDLFRPFAAFASALTLNGLLDARSRELLTLRTAVNCGSDYEWGQHVEGARAAGFGDDDLRCVLEGTASASWSALDTALLRAADELHTHSCISDTTWEALAESLDEQQLIEVAMLVGQYHMAAYAIGALGVQRESGVEPIP